MDDIYQWYVVRTKPRGEYQAEKELRNQGFESYLPELKRYTISAGKERIVKEPLFSRYLFVRLSRTLGRWSAIRFTRGVVGLVAFGDGEPVPVAERTLELIREDCAGRPVERRIQPGVSVKFSPRGFGFQERIEILGELSTLDGEGRAVMLVSLLGRENRVRVKTDHLRSA